MPQSAPPLDRLAALPPGGLAAEASVVQQQAQQHFKRLEPEVTLLEETPAKALKLADPEEPPAKSSRSSTVFLPAGTLQTTSSASSSSRGLAASPTFASNISKVPRRRRGPPNLSDEELEKIDAEAETKEVTRLLQMRVLIPEDENNKIDESYRKLTTKHVKDWCFRENHWQRRSRLVARDYKFLAPELEGLFSPASNSLSTKLWAAVVQSANGEAGTVFG